MEVKVVDIVRDGFTLQNLLGVMVKDVTIVVKLIISNINIVLYVILVVVIIQDIENLDVTIHVPNVNQRNLTKNIYSE